MQKQSRDRVPSDARQFDFLATLLKTGAVSLPKSVLIGAILEIVSDYNRSTAEKIAEWGMIGESFLKGLWEQPTE